MWRKAVQDDAIKNPSMRCRTELVDENSESRTVEGLLIGYRRNGNFLIGHNDSDDSCCLVASECEVWDESQAPDSASRSKTPIGKTMEVLRGTGRTTRMLKCALQLASSGKEVVVVMASERQVDYARDRLYECVEPSRQDAILGGVVGIHPRRLFRIKLPLQGSLFIVGNTKIDFHAKGGFECELLRGRQFDEVLYDHAAIEKQVPWIVKILHAFDPDMQAIIGREQHD
jgi:hypothetical protein